MAARKGNKVAMKAKSPKKTRQGNGKHSKFPGMGSDKSRVSKSYRKKYRGQGK
tara:strand:+ start:615 stop:773 length:159 start_codon:yes stop_codon:yes gene_type:complete